MCSMKQWQNVVRVSSGELAFLLLNDCDKADVNHVVEGYGWPVLDLTGECIVYKGEVDHGDFGDCNQHEEEDEEKGGDSAEDIE